MITRTAKCEVIGQKKKGGAFGTDALGYIALNSYFVVKFRTPDMGLPTTLYAKITLQAEELNDCTLLAYLLDTSSGETVELSTDSKYASTDNWQVDTAVTFELDAAKLKSNKVYYLKVAPEDVEGNGTIAGVNETSAHDFEVTYTCGVVHIDNGTEMEKYQPFIDNGTDWEPVIAYVDNGAGWDIHT